MSDGINIAIGNGHANGSAPPVQVVPTSLDEISLLPDEALAALQGTYAAALTKIAAEQFRRARLPKAPRAEVPARDRTLDADEIAKELGVDRRWVFRNAKRLPFVQRPSRKSVVCYESDLRRWRAAQRD